MMIIAPLSSSFVLRAGNKVVVTLGLFILSGALGLFSLVSATSPLLAVMGITLVLGSGMGLVFAPATDSIMGSLPRAKAGVGSAMNDTTRQTGGAIGVAVMGSVMASRYRSAVLRAAGLAHLTPKITAAAASNVGQAMTIARSGAAGSSSAVVGRIASDSFVSAFHTAVLVGAVVILIAAAGVAMWLPARARDDDAAIAGEVAGDAHLEPAGMLGVEVVTVDG